MWVSVGGAGCGIPEENTTKVFEPLGTIKAKGIWLRLAVSRNLVEANGGCIEVESEVARGGAFTVCLPSARLAS